MVIIIKKNQEHQKVDSNYKEHSEKASEDVVHEQYEMRKEAMLIYEERPKSRAGVETALLEQ